MPDFGKYLTELPEALTLDDDDILYTVVGSGTTTSKKVKKSTILSADRTARATAEGTIVANFASPYSTTTQYAVGDYCIKDLILYKCTSPTSGAWDSSKWTQVTALDLTSGVASDLADEIEARQSADATLQEEIDELPVDVKVDGVSVVDTNNIAQINNKANTTGTYDDLVVGTAQNLLSDSFTEDKVPYNFRQSFNGARLEDEIVGGTVAWNQLGGNGRSVADKDVTNTFDSTTKVHSLSGTANGNGGLWTERLDNYMANRVLYIKSTSANIKIFAVTSTNIYSDNNELIVKTTSGANYYGVLLESGKQYSYDTKYVVVDLTQAFGSTIADYVYSLEQATSGSGIAWLKSYGFLTKTYYAYQSGKLESVNVASRKVVGKNLFDIDKWLNDSGATYTKSGNEYTISAKSELYTKPYVFSDEDVAVSISAKSYKAISATYIRMQILDSNNNIVGELNNSSTYAKVENLVGSKIRFNWSQSGQFSIEEPQLELGSTATAYEPYTKHTYPLDSDLTLRGIPKLDSSNNLYYDGDIYKADGSVTRRYGVVDLGSLTWTTAGSGRHNATLSNAKIGSNQYVANAVCSKYTVLSANDIPNTDKSFCIGVNDNPILQINDSTYNGGDATPTSETADAFINPQIVDARGTEEYVDYAESQGTRDVAIPVGHNSKYFADLKSKIENIPDVPSANGTYTLKATRSASGVTFAWVSG